MWRSIVVISVGASCGALLRWWFGTRLNALFPTIPLGTLTANLVGGYIIGAAVAFFSAYSSMAPEWRLFVMTGFCGGLTTFSTFSAEISGLMKQGLGAWTCAAIVVHVCGSVLMTFAGIGTVAWARS